jgi:hypothetical protein
VSTETFPIVVGDLRPEDDLMHPVGPDAQHNESMFFNFFDEAAGLGGFVRIGNRPNEGHAEMTFCLFLSDGSLLFQWGRPEIADNSGFRAAGLSFDVDEPGLQQRVRFDAAAVHIADPLDMTEPGKTMRTSPAVAVLLDLEAHATGPMVGSASGDPSAVIFLAGVGHYQQPCSYRGTLRFGDTTITIDALGIRDHSWGPRVWQSIRMDRSYWTCFGPQLAFLACKTWLEGEPVDVMGCVIDHGQAHRITDFDLRTWYEPGTARHRAVQLDLTDDRGTTWVLRGQVQSYVPLRHRREGHPIVYLGQALSRFTLDGHGSALGISEYFDNEDAVAEIIALAAAEGEGRLE